MSEKRFTLDDENGLCRCILVDGEEIPTCEICDLLNEQQSIIKDLKEENEKLKLKIVSLENEVKRQTNELKNTRKEFIKKTEEINWLKSEDYLKKIY